MLKFLEDIPDPRLSKWCPCNTSHSTPIQSRLSCLAQKYEMYLVVNAGDVKWCNRTTDSKCPEDQRYQYNTNVVYDTEGCLVVKYHKQNLFFESQFNTPDKVTYAVFDTPFGRFGTFTCFDVLFKEPAIPLVEHYGIDTVLFPTAWMDALPLLAAVQFHSAWARGMGVNFLEANLQIPEAKFCGSGIYTSNGDGVYERNVRSNKEVLLIKTVMNSNDKEKEMIRYKMNLTNVIYATEATFSSYLFGDKFTFSYLETRNGTLKVCQNNLCCSLTYEYTPGKTSSEEKYALGTFDGLHTKEGQYYQQICTVLRCKGIDKSSCGEPVTESDTTFSLIDLRGNFKHDHVFPEVLTTGVNLAFNAWQFDKTEHRIYLNKSIDKPLLSAALYGRVYSLDLN